MVDRFGTEGSEGEAIPGVDLEASDRAGVRVGYEAGKVRRVAGRGTKPRKGLVV